MSVMLKMVGTNCNMRCHYCYESSITHNNTINYNQLLSKDDINDFFNSVKYIDYISVIFHGGEPLLAHKSDVVFTIKTVEKLFPKRHEFQFQTNGILINQEWIDIFKLISSKFSVSISLDPIGKKDLRKSNIAGYRNTVYSNIKALIDNKINVAIISVAHRYNINDFIPFVDKLISSGIRFLTINKYRHASLTTDKMFISEKEYNELLEEILNYWIKNKLYKKIQIQPLMSLLSNAPNKLCGYLADSNKCSHFTTLYKEHTYSCEHLIGKVPIIDETCLNCDIYEWCGGGCLADLKDTTFCDARRNFKTFIERIKHENS
jgi:uncharacterized protein